MKDPTQKTELYSLIQQEMEKPSHPAVGVFRDYLKEYYPSVLGILFYGSCLWNIDQQSQNLGDNLFDFYVLVPGYTGMYQNKVQAFANWLLPPNVYYIELKWEGQLIRAKYAVISLEQFRRGNAGYSLQSALWARFCQPVRLVFAVDETVRQKIIAILSQAVIAMIGHSLPLVPQVFSPALLWVSGFQQTYKAEIRVEKNNRTMQLYQRSQEYYDLLTTAAFKGFPTIIAHNREENYFVKAGSSTSQQYLKRSVNKLGWFSRRLVGKALNVLRLIKALFTFQGALPYALWKIKRHSGIDIPVSAWNLRHPFLSLPVLLGRFYGRHRKQKKMEKE